MIYENISRLCEERRIPICALEKAVGIGNGTIGKWRTQNPRVDKLKKVADYLEVTLDELLDELEIRHS